MTEHATSSSRHRWTPGPSYYIWLRWLTFSSHKVSPPDPKPWERLDRYTREGPDGRPIKTWRRRWGTK